MGRDLGDQCAEYRGCAAKLKPARQFWRAGFCLPIPECLSSAPCCRRAGILFSALFAFPRLLRYHLSGTLRWEVSSHDHDTLPSTHLFSQGKASMLPVRKVPQILSRFTVGRSWFPYFCLETGFWHDS